MNPFQDNRTFIYRIDPNDNIIFVNEEWLSFARENGAYALTRDAVLNKSLWDFITGQETRYLYKLILEKLWSDGGLIKVPFRCDSPDYRRFMELGIFRFQENFVEFRGYIRQLEFRDTVNILDTNIDRSNKIEVMCSWCKKIQVPEIGWVEAEMAIAHLGLLGDSKPFQLSHGICPSCQETVMKSLA